MNLKPLLTSLILVCIVEASFCQVTLKSGFIMDQNPNTSNSPRVRVEVGDFHLNWLLALGFYYSRHITQFQFVPENPITTISNNSIGIQLRFTQKNIERFINFKLKKGIKFKNCIPDFFCGTGAYALWRYDLGLHFRPYFLVSSNYDFYKVSSINTKQRLESAGFGIATSLGVEFLSLGIYHSKLNFYVENGFQNNFYESNFFNQYFGLLGIKLNLSRSQDADFGSREIY